MWTVTIIAIVCAVFGQVREANAYACNNRHYVNSSGHVVHSPSRAGTRASRRIIPRHAVTAAFSLGTPSWDVLWSSRGYSAGSEAGTRVGGLSFGFRPRPPLETILAARGLVGLHRIDGGCEFDHRLRCAPHPFEVRLELIGASAAVADHDQLKISPISFRKMLSSRSLFERERHVRGYLPFGQSNATCACMSSPRKYDA